MLYPAELCGHFIGEGSRLVKSIPNDSIVSIFALIAALKQAKKNGAPERTRTSNHQNRNLLLYPLSYGHSAQLILVHTPWKIKSDSNPAPAECSL